MVGGDGVFGYVTPISLFFCFRIPIVILHIFTWFGLVWDPSLYCVILYFWNQFFFSFNHFWFGLVRIDIFSPNLYTNEMKKVHKARDNKVGCVI